MSNDLRERLRSLRTAERRIKPDAAWVSRTRSALLKDVASALPKERMPVTERVGMAFSTLIGNRIVNLLRKPVMAVLSAIAVIAGGSIISVSAAERSLPGDFFYGLKLVTEQARLALTSAKEDRLVLKTEFTERRVTELQQIANDPARPDHVVEVAETLKRDLDTVKQQLADVKSTSSPEKAVAAAKLVDQKANKVMTDLQEAKAVLPLQTIEKVTEAQSAAADAGVSALAVLAETHETANDAVAAEDITQAIQNHAKIVSDVTATGLLLANPLATSSTTSTIVFYSGTAPTSTDPAVTTTLPALVSQVKDLTSQAFAQQKVKDQQEAGTSVLPQTQDSPSGSATGTSPSSSSTSTTPTPVTPTSTSSTLQSISSTGTPPVNGG